MLLTSDSRIPVHFNGAETATTDDAIAGDGTGGGTGDGIGDGVGATPPGVTFYPLQPGPPGLAGHAPGCPCCAPRSAATRALTALFHARARGEIASFRRLFIAVEAARVGPLREAFAEDRFLAARYVVVAP